MVSAALSNRCTGSARSCSVEPRAQARRLRRVQRSACVTFKKAVVAQREHVRRNHGLLVDLSVGRSRCDGAFLDTVAAWTTAFRCPAIYNGFATPPSRRSWPFARSRRRTRHPRTPARSTAEALGASASMTVTPASCSSLERLEDAVRTHVSPVLKRFFSSVSRSVLSSSV